MSDRPDIGPRTEAAELFALHRKHLLSVAYRFLGSVADAEDIVQETYLRWCAVAPDEIREPKGFLTRVAARLCIDQLKSARLRRERYVGPWLPEPLVEELGFAVESEAGKAADLSVALMLALERLSPLERAAFVLHDTFGLSFEEVSKALGRSSAACRQLAARARKNLRVERPRFEVPAGEGERVAEAFLQAANTGNLETLIRLLAPESVLYSDSGGKVRSARRQILGAQRIARLFAVLSRRFGPPRFAVAARVNGLPGFVMEDALGVKQTLALEIANGRIAALYLVRNPDKLKHVLLPRKD